MCLLSIIIFSHLVPLCLISILYCGLTLILKLNEENKDTSWGLEYNYEPGHNNSRGINEDLVGGGGKKKRKRKIDDD